MQTDIDVPNHKKPAKYEPNAKLVDFKISAVD